MFNYAEIAAWLEAITLPEIEFRVAIMVVEEHASLESSRERQTVP
jgi:hypothetical protein